jgi:hypothetical protein
MSALLTQIQDAAIDSKEPIANVLRKLAVLASRLENEELGAWAFRELNGYGPDYALPDYRIIAAHASVNLAGAFGSGYKNVIVPALLLPEQLREYAERVHLPQPIATLEELATKDRTEPGELTFPWPGNLTALMQKEDKFNGHVIVSAWQSTSTAAMTGIVDTVRNRVLEFSLKLQKDVPMAGDDDSKASPAVVQAATQYFQTIILGNHTGNIAAGSPGAVQMTSVVNKGDLGGLVRALAEHGVPATEVKELEGAIAEEGNAQGMGPKAGAWLAKATTAVIGGTWKLASGVGIGVITKLVLSYYGIH